MGVHLHPRLQDLLLRLDLHHLQEAP